MAGASVTPQKLVAGLCLLFAVTDLTNGDRVKNKIYQDIQGDMACFKRFNGTHEIGCTSKFYGNLGVVHVVARTEDLTWVLEHGPHQPYVLALYPEFMTVEVLQQAQHSAKVSGVILMVEEGFDPASLNSGFSGEKPCPNEELGLYNPSLNPDPEYAGYCQKKPWNTNGTSLLYMNWNFPIFLVDNQTSINYVIECYQNFNEPIDGVAKSWPLCYTELKSNMFGTTNTEVCMRRRALNSRFQPVNFCDPLYDYNIWGTLKPMNSTEVIPEKSVIIVATRMDAASMFDNISPGANSAISGLVTLMIAAEAIYKRKEEIMKSGSQKNVLFVIFQGETWGYIGSSRMVWDMEKGQFPFEPQENEPDQMSQVNFTHINSFIELAQVGQGMVGDLSNLFLHTDPVSNFNSDIKSETERVLNSIHLAAEKSDFVNVENTNDAPLPPASLQSFLKRVNISGVVITDHKEGFKNKFYESIFDNYLNVNYNANSSSEDTNQIEDKYHQHISHVASVVATAVYSLVTESQPSSLITVNQNLTNDLLYCYLRNVSCQLFQDYGEALLLSDFFNDKPAKMYVSVKRGESGRTTVTNSIFASLLGEKKDYNVSACTTDSFYQVSQFYYFSSIDNGTCFQSTVRKTEAMSPAFLIDNYDWQSGEYSTWTESGWQLTALRIFLRPSVVEEAALVSGGVVSLLLSLGLVYFMNSRADILFGVTNPPAAC